MFLFSMYINEDIYYSIGKGVKATNIVVIKPLPEETKNGNSLKDVPPPADVVKVVKTAMPKAKPPNPLLTTFMADFRAHYNVKRRTSCKPPESDHQFIDAPFNGTSNYGDAFKVFPVAPPEKQLWAIKPDYKRPHVGMLVNSTYMVS